MDVEVPGAVIETTTPQERLALVQLVQTEYDKASKLLEEKMYKEALKKYKWVFSQTVKPDFFLSTSEIKKLMKGYPPATKVIQRWRNDKEKLIMARRFDHSLISEWCRLNLCLGEKTREFEVFQKLKASGAEENLLHNILSDIWKSFVVSKEYGALETYLPNLGFRILHHAIEYDGVLLFPRHTDSKQSKDYELNYHTTYMLEGGTMSYEVALGLGMKSVAFEFAKKILSVESSDRAYAGLIRGAIRARGYDEAIELFKEAKESFTSRQLRKTFKEIRRLPKARLSNLGLSR